MNGQDIELARSATQAEKDQLERELGEHLLAGGDEKHGAELTKRLSRASAKLEEIESKAAAITAAQNAAARVAADRAERDAQDALEQRIRAAHDDLVDIRKAAGGVDRALADLDQAMSDLSGLTDDYLAKHESLGIDPNVREFFRLRGWCAEILTHMKNKGARPMRNYLAISRILTFGSGKAIADTMPDISRVLTGREKVTTHGGCPLGRFLTPCVDGAR